MSDDRLHELLAGYLADAYLGDEPPDLDPDAGPRQPRGIR
jgi:hypothetical protein